jgi:DNA polymerase-3 subunit delta'
VTAPGEQKERPPLPALSRPLPWQDGVWQRWYEALARQRLPHALMLCAPTDSGEHALLYTLARSLLCSQATPAGNCGHCRHCELTATRGHSDLRELAPQGKSHSIGIDAVRELIDFAARTSALASCKVAVLAGAEHMTLAAANALLKVLEEPPAGTFLILSTHSPAAVPATVRSRCQLTPCPLPGQGVAREWLLEQDAPAAEIDAALKLCAGRPLAAQRLLTQGQLPERLALHRALADWLRGGALAPALHAHLQRLPPAELLQQLHVGIATQLREQRAAELRSSRSRALLRLCSELSALQRALASGANPRPELLYGDLRARLREIAQMAPALGQGGGGC